MTQPTFDTRSLESVIDAAFERRSAIAPGNVEPDVATAVEQVIAGLDAGRLRVAERRDGAWVTNEWIKKAVLLYFRTHDNRVMDGGTMQFFDKVPTKYESFSESAFREGGVRVVPPAVVRRGAYIGSGAILMPSYVNIGAYVDEGTMVDTWATVGSCAQIGRHVHLSGGVGIGGVLEPLQANPTIIEDNCFIGARSEIVEGVIVEANSVISMGVFIGQSTRIYDRTTGEVLYGRVPSGSVVVPGTLPAADGTHSLYCAVIVKRVDAQTRAKTSPNELLRA
jgi:2,3,4,5-tetrahydropyridine-2-carboxylate N-succinyltransferase